MSLYMCKLTFDIVVVADSKIIANEIAISRIKEEVIAEPETTVVFEVTDINQLPEAWKNSIPYGNNNDDSTCRDRISRRPAN